MIWIFFFINMALVTAAVASDNVVIGGSVGNVFKNSPHIITTYTLLLCLLGLLMPTAFFNNAALRDYQYKFNEILFSTPLSRLSYFFGRFWGAYVLSIFPFLGIFLGFFMGAGLGLSTGWLDAERIGPFYFSAFFNNFVLIIMPNVFFAGCLIFALANRWRSSVISFVGALLIIVVYLISLNLASDLDNEMMAALSDTFGLRTYNIDNKYATSIEKNQFGIGFSSLVLTNRLIWTGLGALVLALSAWSFSFVPKSKKSKKVATPKESTTPVAANLAKPTFSINIQNTAQQFASFFSLNFYSITRSVTFKVLFIFGGILFVSSIMGGFEYFGLQSYPVTYKMADVIKNSNRLFEVIILTFFAGELVWRDRSVKLNEVIDATPHLSVVSLLAKVASLILAVSLLHVFTIGIAILYQLADGYTNLELGLYAQFFLFDAFPFFIFWAFFLVAIQVLVNNKYLGYFIAILIFFAYDIMLAIFEWQSNMVDFGGVPSYTYSDMNGFGPSLTAIGWFHAYWILFAAALLGGAGLVWNRGATQGWSNRVKAAKKHLSRSYKMILGAVIGAWLVVAGIVYYNTQILNDYENSSLTEGYRADYEKNYKQYEGIPQPKVTEAIYNIDIFPEDRNVLTTSEVTLTNKDHVTIDSLHLIISDDWDIKVSIPNSERVFWDSTTGYTIYKLAQPLGAHQKMKMKVTANYISKGFENSVSNTNIVRNGTFFNNMSILPNIGYNASYELSDKYTRKKYDLKEKVRMQPLESPCNHQCMSNYLTQGAADWVRVETFISTSNTQTAIAPGSLINMEEKDGRRHYHYKLDHIAQNFYSFMSAEYELASRKWKEVDIEIYYDKKHATNVEMMLDAVEDALVYYTKHFGPYYHKQARILEFPRYATFAQAFPGTMPYSESFGFIINLEDAKDNNVINAVIAHEMAHQWWAHQVIGSNMEGGTMLSESFAEYSSLMVMKHQTNDPIKMRKFLKYDFNRYLRGRSRETKEEKPLYKVQNQSYIHYGKGSIILYALQDYIGEDSVNLAMREFLEAYRYKEPPYPTSLDFLRYLEPRTPDSLRYLIDDWFKEITLYDYRLQEATLAKLDNGKYRVDFNISAKKMHVDSTGKENPVPFKDWVDIGLYADSEEKELLATKRVLFDQETLSFSLEVDKEPAKAAIDPKRLLIERNISDNVKAL